MRRRWELITVFGLAAFMAGGRGLKGSNTIQPLVAEIDVVVEAVSPARPAITMARLVAAGDSGFVLSERRSESPGSQEFDTRRIHLANGDVVDVADGVRMKTTWPGEASGWRQQRLRLMANQCAGTGDRFAGFEEIQGLRAAKVESRNGDFVRWLHLESGCTEVQALLVWRNANGDVVSRTQYRLRSHRAGPMSRYLEVPEDYRETPPDEVRRAQTVAWYDGEEKAAAAAKSNAEVRKILELGYGDNRVYFARRSGAR